jgi:hypothetical protein
MSAAARLGRRAQPGEELLQRRRDRPRCFAEGGRVGNLDELVLGCTDLLPQTNRVQRGALLFHSASHLLADPRVRQQPLTGRGWRVMALSDLLNFAPSRAFAASLNEGWKKFTNGCIAAYNRARAAVASGPSKRR